MAEEIDIETRDPENLNDPIEPPPDPQPTARGPARGTAKTADELDMENRDPENLNQHIQMRFEDVFGEPAGVRSIDCVWRLAFKCFTCSLSCCYNLMTILCGIPLALFWGFAYAHIALRNIWVNTPCLKCCLVELIVIRKMFEACLGAFIGPCCATCGMCFSNIRVKNG